MRKICLIRPLNIVFLLIPLIGFSQPGGGGGVLIKHVYDSSGKEIDVENSEEYKLTCYLLGDTLLASKNVYSKLENHFQNYQVDSMGYVPDYRDSSKMISARFSPVYKYKSIKLKPINFIENDRSAPFDNFRIMLSTQKDTMIVDFIKAIGENAHGIKSVIDSFSFVPGYFQYKKRKVYPISYPEDTFWNVDSVDLRMYSSLTINEHRFLGELQLLRINEELKQLSNQIRDLLESEEWKMYSERDKDYVLGELERQLDNANWYRKKLLSQKKAFLESLND